MFRNQYDTDVTVWSPQGRLHQVEYASEAVNQGTICLGIRSSTYALLAGIKRSPSELASHQRKLFKVDAHMGIGMSGLTADGRSLLKYMRSEALNHKYAYGSPIPGNRLVLELADLHQRCTQSYVRRPYGVGLLVATCDPTGPHLYVTEPSGNYYEYVAMAIGSRSQTSRTYLEREFKNFNDCSKDDLIKHALKALACSLAGDAELDVKSVTLALVGVDQEFEFISEAELQAHLDAVEVEGSGSAEPEGLLESPDI